MDQITKHKLDRAANDLIASIDPSNICNLASSYHPDKKPCRIFSDWKKGSYNVCFPVVFQDSDGGESEKWMVRIPLLPRLAFPEEKMRSEIATMKYIAEKTTIPIPRLYAYSLGIDNVLGLPFMLLEYVEGNTLFGVQIEELEPETKEHLYSQLADVYIELYQQQFDRVGALTLDDDGHWIFADNRPLTVDINEQQVSGLDICRYMPPNQTFTSAIDYFYMLTRLLFNDFYRGRDSIVDEEDARNYLYSIYASQGLLMEWTKPEYNHGPFVLIHGDLRPPNIIVDNAFNIISILDWEWSHTVPAQMFVAPSWLTNEELLRISHDIPSLFYIVAAGDFKRTVMTQEFGRYRLPRSELPLYSLWQATQTTFRDTLIGHALLKPHYFGSVYCHALDTHYYGKDCERRVQAFFELNIRKSELQKVKQKVLEFEQFEKERKELGIEARITLENPTRTPAEEAELLEQLKKFREIGKPEKQANEFDKPQIELIKHEESPRSLSHHFRNWRHRFTASPSVEGIIEKDRTRLRWPLIGITTCFLIEANQSCV